MSEYEYRIKYTIQRAPIDSDEWEEVGFGSSGGWNSMDAVDAALYAVDSYVQNRQWETEPGPEFDRWLAAHDREVAARTLREAAELFADELGSAGSSILLGHADGVEKGRGCLIS